MLINSDLNDMFDMDDEDKLNEQFDDFMSNIDNIEDAKDVLNQMMEYEDEALDYWEKVRHLRCKAQRRIKSLKKDDVDKYIGKCFRFAVGSDKYGDVKYFKIIDIDVLNNKSSDIVARCLTLNNRLYDIGIETRNMMLWDYEGLNEDMIIELIDEISEDEFNRRLGYWKNKIFKGENMDA